MVQVPPEVVMEMHSLLAKATKLWANSIKDQYQRYDEQYATEMVSPDWNISMTSVLNGISLYWFKANYVKYLQKRSQSDAMKDTRHTLPVIRPNGCDQRNSNDDVDAIVQKPKRPVSPFILYRLEVAKTEKVGASEAALRWRNLDAEQQQNFHQQYQIAQSQYK